MLGDEPIPNPPDAGLYDGIAACFHCQIALGIHAHRSSCEVG